MSFLLPFRKRKDMTPSRDMIAGYQPADAMDELRQGTGFLYSLINYPQLGLLPSDGVAPIFPEPSAAPK